MTGGRVKRLQKLIGKETFMLTYGDGVADINLDSLLSFHKSHGKLVTVSAVRPPARFGAIKLQGDVLVPLDSHFPVEKFKAITDAYEIEDKKSISDLDV